MRLIWNRKIKEGGRFLCFVSVSVIAYKCKFCPLSGPLSSEQSGINVLEVIPRVLFIHHFLTQNRRQILNALEGLLWHPFRYVTIDSEPSVVVFDCWWARVTEGEPLPLGVSKALQSSWWCLNAITLLFRAWSSQHEGVKPVMKALHLHTCLLKLLKVFYFM